MRDYAGSLQTRREAGATALEALNRMLDTATGEGVLSVPGAALGARDDPRATLAAEDGVLVLLSGRPRWRETGALAEAHQIPWRWRALGRDLPSLLLGNFALVVVDVPAATVLLAIDRLGIESLAFAARPHFIAFARRVDRLAAHPALDAGLDPQGLFNLLFFHQIPAPGSIFQGIEKLLPGEWALWREGRLERGFYWRMQYRDAPRRDVRAQAERLRALLRQCVARASEGEEVATFLSGGTDSSTVSGMLAGLCERPVRAYCIGFEAAEFDESDYARLAARHFGLDLRIHVPTPDEVLGCIPLIARHYDEPFANESAVAAYLCARRAAEDGYGVMLAGDGGDELFGGNARYGAQRLFTPYQELPRALRERLIEPLAGQPWMQRLWLGRKLRGYVRQARIPLPERLEAWNLLYREPLASILEPDFRAAIDPEQPLAGLREVWGRTATRNTIDQMLHLDLKITLADNDLRKVSRMTEAAGIEVRYPLLDEALVAFSGELPPGWKVRHGELRWFFRHALRGWLPDAILDKRKHGFGLPFGLWLREDAALRERVTERLAALGQRGWLRPSWISAIETAHRTQHATYYGAMIWTLLMLEEWLQARHL